MFGCMLLACCLGCFCIGKASLTRYQRSPLFDPVLLGDSTMWFLGAALNLAAAAVLFTR
jgi:hypothetical protein